MYIKDPTSDWIVYLTNSPVEDVFMADDIDDVVYLYEHDRNDNRVPWYPTNDKSSVWTFTEQEWSVVELKGNIRIERKASATAENHDASEWFKKFKTITDHSLYGLGVVCEVDTEVSFIMTGYDGNGVPCFCIPQFGNKYKDCDWTITYLSEHGSHDVCLTVSRLDRGYSKNVEKVK